MSNKAKTVILAAILVLIIAAAGAAYNRLARDYETPPVVTPNVQPQGDGQQAEFPQAAQPQPEYAPDFEVLDGDGVTVSLSDLRGKPVVVNFWATWCGSCKSALPAYEQAYADYGDSIELMMVNMTDGSSDTVESVKAFNAEQGYSFPVYYDTTFSASAAYGVYSIPMTVVIAPDGTLLGGQVGAMSEQALYELIDAAIAYGE